MSPAPRPARPATSCVVPAYNEAANLPLLLPRLIAQLRALTDSWEVLIVDDGSADATPETMRAWTAEPGVRYLRLSRNFGKEAALTAGIDHADGEVVILLDADLQHPPELLSRMIEAWQGGADMVCAVRESRDDESIAKRIGTALFYYLVNRQSSVQIPPDAGDFRLMDRAVVEALKALPERNRFMKGLYAWVGFRSQLIGYVPDERQAGESTFSLRSLWRLAVTGVTAFTNFPLRLCSGFGIAVAFVAMLLAVYFVAEHYLWGESVPGWATIVTSVMFFSGVQLLSIGILGEYVGRIFDEVKQRPIYLIGGEAGRGALQGRQTSRLPPPGVREASRRADDAGRYARRA